MTYRVYGPGALLKEADFTLSLSLEGAYEAKNADGTNPSATLKVQGTTIQFALAIMSQLAEDDGALVAKAMVDKIRGEFGFDYSDENPTGEQLTEMTKKLVEEHDQFLTVAVATKGVTDEGEEQEVTLTLTAPSYVIGLKVFLALTTPQGLRNLGTSFMPIDREYGEYDEEDNEV